MKKTLPKIVLGLLCLILVLSFCCKRILNIQPNLDSSHPEQGSVVIVYDGDTIEVEFDNHTNRKVRLIGIDAPEIGHSNEETQFQAYMSKRFTFHHLFRKQVKLSFDKELEDKYGRLLAYVWTDKEGLFNRFILQEGFAFAYLFFPFRDDYRQAFEEAEEEARRFKKGFWRNDSYQKVSTSDAINHLGKIVSVVFFCSQLRPHKDFLFMHSLRDDFAGLIPEENLSNFPDPKIFKGKTLSVTGFLEEYKGQPQILLFLACQIKIVI